MLAPRLSAGLLALLGLLPLVGTGGDVPTPKAAFATITEDDLRLDLVNLASAPLEGRDSPSVGLSRAADYIIARMEAAGFTGAGEDGAFLMPFTSRRAAPVEESCELHLLGGENAEERDFVIHQDFVPVFNTAGTAEGELVFLHFGIESSDDKYDDIKGDLKGRIAVIVEGEPRHRKKFDGPEVTRAADLYEKLEHLDNADLAGVLVVRRPPAAEKSRSRNKLPEPEPARLGFRHTWASWAGLPAHRSKRVDMPVLEITPAIAEALLGLDVLPLVAKIDKSGKAAKPIETGRQVYMAAATEERDVRIDNVVGILRGSDPELADEYVVIGAHYDHVGVDSRGRIGFGADDNASGTAAMLEIISALATAGPRRSILACAFAAEEDGLAGSAALVDRPPVPIESMVAMINMDMVGRGPVDEVVVLGLIKNPGFEKLLKRAKKLQPTRVKNIVQRQGQDLFKRSDHYSFHKKRVPAMFFFEQLPIDKNKDYHTWRDTIEELDFEKIARTSRLVFNTAWLLATDDERPPAPKP
jgi:hypothetical protein